MEARGRLFAAMVLASGGLVLAGCAAGNAQSGSQPIVITTTVATVAHAVTATNTDNGHTITIANGGTLTVRLDSTYWRFGTNTSSAALRSAGQPTVTAMPMTATNCVPGQGCGTVTAIFQAVAPGKAVVTATRTTCGEAMACTPAQAAYQLTVLVN
jgi:predicted secreted protein